MDAYLSYVARKVASQVGGQGWASGDRGNSDLKAWLGLMRPDPHLNNHASLSQCALPDSWSASHDCMQVPGHALGACKEAINKAASDALLAYRTHCAAASSSGQLILPEALKLLPLYTLALSKAAVFRTDSRPDVRAAAMWRLLSLPAHKAMPLVYGRMLPLHNLLERPKVSPSTGRPAWQLP
jgi:hypothetical protein